MNARPQDEFCPCCGRWVAQLDDATGWCSACAGSTPDGTPCRKCGRAKPTSHYSHRNWRGVCRACRTEAKNRWRAANPDRDRANNLAAYARRRAQPGTTPIAARSFVEYGPGRVNGLALAATSPREATTMIHDTPLGDPCDEVCPSCGAFVATLDDATGWCSKCIGHKSCGRCHAFKPLAEYRSHARARDGHRGTCRACEREADRLWRLANIDRERTRQRERARRYRERRRATA